MTADQQAADPQGAVLNPITESLELAAERCEDLTPIVYDRLFRERPETRTMFRTEGSTLVKGSMLQLSLDAILDFAGERKASHRMIFCEVQSHECYGTPPELFGVFFTVIADCLRELLGNDWSPAMETAWSKLLTDLDVYVNDAIRAVYGTPAR
jgi:hemoglobin-like flavoprotein